MRAYRRTPTRRGTLICNDYTAPAHLLIPHFTLSSKNSHTHSPKVQQILAIFCKTELTIPVGTQVKDRVCANSIQPPSGSLNSEI